MRDEAGRAEAASHRFLDGRRHQRKNLIVPTIHARELGQLPTATYR
jgi:hypothetical protein